VRALVVVAALTQQVSLMSFQNCRQIHDLPGARSGQLPFLGSTVARSRKLKRWRRSGSGCGAAGNI